MKPPQVRPENLGLYNWRCETQVEMLALGIHYHG